MYLAKTFHVTCIEDERQGMPRWLRLTILSFLTLIGVIPLILARVGYFHDSVGVYPLAGINFLGWALVVVFLIYREDLRQLLTPAAERLGIEWQFTSLEVLLAAVLREVERRNHSLQIGAMENVIRTKEELSRSLERIVMYAFKALEAESAELALFDKESNQFHSSLVLGKPFAVGSQAMLMASDAGANSAENQLPPEVMAQFITFSGATLGSLRVALKAGRVPTQADREVLRLIALSGGLTILNAQFAQSLMRMKSASEESVRAKTGFLANLSHELRGPLGIIVNAVDLVVDGLCGPVSADQLETLKLVRGNTEHLLDLINDVLDYAKLESGKVQPQRVDIPVEELLEDITAVLRVQAEAKRHRLVLYRKNDDRLAIHCDRRHARQMMINILTNAIKYTPDGGTIEVWADRATGNKVRLNVRDSGVGIPERDRHKVFAAFERVEDSYSSQQSGTGLGMPLTRKLAEANGGIVDFASTPGEETHFWLVFPAAELQEVVRSTESAVEEDAVGKGELILLIQRNDDERRMLERYLSHIGFQVSPARSVQEAVELIKTRSVDLAIFDNDVVDSPNEEVMKRIRDAAGAMPLHSILLSSRAFVFDIEKYLRAGIDRCLAKPIVMKRLGHICRELIDGVAETPSVSRDSDKQPRADKRSAPKGIGRVINVDDISK